jgi:molybdate transport system substrate-binding protein
LRQARVSLTPVTQEADVKAVLAKVQLDEVDAGIVYVTDVRSAGDRVRGIEIPAAVNASTSYPIAVLRAAPNPLAAQAFVDFVRSSRGQQALAEAGFEPAAGTP